MSASPEATARAFIERVWNARNLEAFHEFVSPDVIYRPARGEAKRHDEYREMIARFLAAFPDLRFTIEEALAGRDVVALRLRITGTHSGAGHLGVAPTGRAVDVQGRPWFRVRDGRIVGVWALYDERGMIEQMMGSA